MNTINFKKVFVTAAALPLILLLSVSLLAVGGEPTQANAAIASARSGLLSCFTQAQKAENEGANITGLISILNKANMLLSEAELAYSRNDSAEAYNLALQSQSQLNNFTSQVNPTVRSAVTQKNQNEIVYFASFVGALTIITLGIAEWTYFYRKRLFEE